MDMGISARDMADSSSLLSHSHPDELSPPVLEKLVAATVDDRIERCIGSFGCSQFLQVILVSCAWLFDAQQTFITVFTDAEPSWHCVRPDDHACNSAPNQCSLSKGAWAWDVPAHTSIVSQWGLECANAFLLGLPTSSFFAGCLVGGLVLATLADSSLGRKNMLLLSCLVMSLAGILTAFAPNVWAYSMLRFVGGFGRATIGASSLVLSTEVVGKRWRGEVGYVGFFCFTFGFLSLPAIAYLTRGSPWTILYLITSVPTIFYCVLVYFVVQESPRWLLVQGRKEEAIKSLKRIASSKADNNLSFIFSEVSIKEDTRQLSLYSAFKILYERRWAFRRLTVIALMSFGIGIVYYGLPLVVGNLAVNTYLGVSLTALLELMALLLTFFLIGRANRRSTLLAFTVISGACSIVCVFFDEGHEVLQITMEIVSFLSGSAAFGVLSIYTLELFPTCVRNFAMSMARQALVTGGMFSPVLVAAGTGRKDGLWSYGVFGVVIGCCGFPVCFLPETRGAVLCDTMEEQEHNENKLATTVSYNGSV